MCLSLIASFCTVLSVLRARAHQSTSGSIRRQRPVVERRPARENGRTTLVVDARRSRLALSFHGPRWMLRVFGLMHVNASSPKPLPRLINLCVSRIYCRYARDAALGGIISRHANATLAGARGERYSRDHSRTASFRLILLNLPWSRYKSILHGCVDRRVFLTSDDSYSSEIFATH